MNPAMKNAESLKICRSEVMKNCHTLDQYEALAPDHPRTQMKTRYQKYMDAVTLWWKRENHITLPE